MKNTNKNHQNYSAGFRRNLAKKNSPSPKRRRPLKRAQRTLISNSQSERKLALGFHIPVLETEVLHYLDPKIGDSYLDLTAGYGGHAALVLERTLRPKKAVLVDRDQNAIDYLQKKFAGAPVEIIHQDYASAAEQLLRQGRQFDTILADLGVSSPHLDSSSRGFSVRLDGPLDMRMDQSQKLTAADIVNKYSTAQLTDILRRFGEEPRANRIARLIEAHRPITTTSQLASIVAKAWPGRGKRNPALRTFQALRIAVNDELEILQRALPLWIKLLSLNGRLVIITFHSLEDRIVKQTLAEHAGGRYDAELRVLTSKPISASDTELASNPRARSAKLRAAVKINRKGD